MTAEKIASFDFHDEIDFVLEEEADIALDIPEEHLPPDPDDADCLPSQIHTSYPYGNPTKLTHPAALGTYPFGLGHAHLYSQITYSPIGPQNAVSANHPPTSASSVVYSSSLGPLKWDDLALDELLPVDPKKIEAEIAAKARRSATGAAQNGGNGGADPQQQQPPPDPQQPTDDDEEDVSDGEDDDDGEEEPEESTDESGDY
ncbi:hypothetical protein BS47DRAFT_1352829 [Hydnum rufescens UP504]|uniref:Uncharacterized protein n=1 Tax=Hydnum rufescens UP504 TaxID=1448309 RepID=A0A9P6AJC0_9AGAM|nr:hypothetical protein BS47DRAFT_1352829 [Hydnum rufescens UP504]